jgi:hypothetical protein
LKTEVEQMAYNAITNLVGEDEGLVWRHVTLALEDDGFKFFEASNEAEAIQVLDRHRGNVHRHRYAW